LNLLKELLRQLFFVVPQWHLNKKETFVKTKSPKYEVTNCDLIKKTHIRPAFCLHRARRRDAFGRSKKSYCYSRKHRYYACFRAGAGGAAGSIDNLYLAIGELAARIEEKKKEQRTKIGFEIPGQARNDGGKARTE
jgi:hypothetical protein